MLYYFPFVNIFCQPMRWYNIVYKFADFPIYIINIGFCITMARLIKLHFVYSEFICGHFSLLQSEYLINALYIIIICETKFI